MKRKNFTRITIFTFATILIFTVLTPIFAFANENETESNTIETIPKNENTSETSYNTESGEEEKGGSNEVSDKNVNFFDALFNTVAANSSEILSALAFIGSLIIMICYKRGFLPIVNEGLGAITAGVKIINEKTNALNFGADELSTRVDERLQNAEDILQKIELISEDLERKFKSIEGIKNEQNVTNSVLYAEIDMLYEIFMSASLPQYLKDNVGEKVRDMKVKLNSEAKNEEC